MSRPIIGISLDFAEEGSFSSRPHIALREHYHRAVWTCGGQPIMLPPIINAIPEQIALCDGIMIPGGEFATPTEWYVNGSDASPYDSLDTRLHYDMALVSAVIEQNVPVLAICAGMQLMAGMLDGKLTPNVMTHYQTSFDHMHAAKAEQPAHDITIQKGSIIHRLVGHESVSVNSAHREGVVSVPKGASLTATSHDGVIEAFELEQHPFALAVQWHPEFLSATENADHRLIEGLVSAASKSSISASN